MTRIVLVASSVLLAALGLACLLLPGPLAEALLLPDGALQALPVAAGPLIGIAGLNWAGRGAIYGGIYGRPVVFANFLNAGIGTLVLVTMQAEAWPLLRWLLVAAFALYWLAFRLSPAVWCRPCDWLSVAGCCG